MRHINIICENRESFALDKKEHAQLQTEWDREYKMYFFELNEKHFRILMDSLEEQSFLCLACDAEDIVKYLWKFHDISTLKVEMF